MDKQQILDILAENHVLMQGHFLLTSGRHSNKYLQCARLFQKADVSEKICKILAQSFEGEKIDVVAGPAMGAVLMAYEVSRHLHVPNYFAEREEGKLTFRRGFQIKEGERVLIVEDVITTGGSVKEVMELVKAAGGIVAGIGCVVDRTGGEIDFGVPLKSVISMKVESWEAESCPLCKTGEPLVKPGSRKVKPVK